MLSIAQGMGKFGLLSAFEGSLGEAFEQTVFAKPVGRFLTVPEPLINQICVDGHSSPFCHFTSL